MASGNPLNQTTINSHTVMNDNLTKGRIAKLRNQIEALGLQVPVLQDDLSLPEQEAVLKEFYKSNKASGAGAISDLRRKADLRGLHYDDETSEDALRTEIEEFDKRMKAESAAKMDARKEQQLIGLTPDMLKELGRTIGDSIAGANKDDKDLRIVTEREYDPDDLVEAKTYFAPMIYYPLPMKKVGGQRVRPPFGKIQFKLLEGSSVRVGDQNQTRYISSYTTDSRKEQAYIETHPHFNKKFFASDAKARISSEEHKFAVKFGERMNMLRTYQAPALYNLAGEMKLPVDVGMSLDSIRDMIAGEQAKEDVAREKAHRQELIMATERERLLRQATA